MGSPKRRPRAASAGPLPAPPRTNLMLVKDDVRRTLNELTPEEAAELLRRVALEDSRSPGEGIAGPYSAALSEMQADRAAKLVADAGGPQVFADAIKPPSMDDVLGDLPPSAPDTSSLSKSQAAALKEVVDLMSAYERARTEAADKLRQMDGGPNTRVAGDTPLNEVTLNPALDFETSPQAQAMRDRIEEIVILNSLDDVVPTDGGQSISDMFSSLAPTIGELPAADGQRNYRATRADFPQGDKLSTYMGDKAEDYIVKDDPFRGDAAGDFMKLSGAQAKQMLQRAGFTPKQINGMRPEEIYQRVTEMQDKNPAPGAPAVQTTMVRGSKGEDVEVTLPGGAPGRDSRRMQAERMAANIAQLEAMPALTGAKPKAAAVQATNRSNQIAALRDNLAKLQQTPVYAPGDSARKANRLQKRAEELAALPVDPNADLFKHVTTGDNSGIEAFPDEASQLSAIAFLQQRRNEMLARMGKAKPPVLPTGQVVEMTAQGSSPNAMRSPAQVKMEQWLEASGIKGSDLHGLTVDPVTGERSVVGSEGYFGNPSERAAMKPPGYVYGIPPKVDADGNVTHPMEPMSGDLAARTYAWTLGAQDPRFAETITPAMQDAIDENWWTVPGKREAGSGMLYQEPDGTVVRKTMNPGPTGLKHLQNVARFQAGRSGGGAGGGSMNIQTQARRPRIDDARTPTMAELMNMPLEEGLQMAPDTPPMPTPQGQQTMADLEAAGVEGDMEQVLGPAARRPASVDDVNRMLDDIPVEEDDTGFLGRTSMNRMPRRDLLTGLLA